MDPSRRSERGPRWRQAVELDSTAWQPSLCRRRRVDPAELGRAGEHAVGAGDRNDRCSLGTDTLVHRAGAADLFTDQRHLRERVLAVDLAGTLQVRGQVGLDTELEDAVGNRRARTLAVAADGIALPDDRTGVPARCRDASGSWRRDRRWGRRARRDRHTREHRGCLRQCHRGDAGQGESGREGRELVEGTGHVAFSFRG